QFCAPPLAFETVTATKGRTAQVLVQRVAADGRRQRVPDEVIVEGPMSILLDGHLVTTTMRTPGNDFELAVGLCFTDGLLDGAPVLRCRYCGEERASESDFNVVTVETGHRAPVPTARVATTTSSCGLCGSTSIDDLRERLRPLPPIEPWSPEMLVRAPARIRDEQALFGATGSVHA